jgi:hypothetical protein
VCEGAPTTAPLFQLQLRYVAEVWIYGGASRLEQPFWDVD